MDLNEDSDLVLFLRTRVEGFLHNSSDHPKVEGATRAGFLRLNSLMDKSKGDCLGLIIKDPRTENSGFQGRLENDIGFLGRLTENFHIRRKAPTKLM